MPFFAGEFTKEEVLESAKEHIMISKLEEFIQNESNVAAHLQSKLQQLHEQGQYRDLYVTEKAEETWLIRDKKDVKFSVK